ncbi:MAG: hypothetical protein ACFFFB_22430 [Candidatus Heimdallarchaeota archaeon]
MVLFQLTVTRFLTVYVAQGLVCAFFIFLAYKILKRDRKRLNIIFSGFYLSAAIGLLMNFIYAPLSDEAVVKFLNYLTNFGIFYSPIFLVVFNLILLKSEKVITTIKQLAILIGFGVYMFCMIFFILTPDMGVTIDASTEWSPEWSLPFFLYLIIGVSVLAVGPILYFSFKVYNKFEDVQLKKKWRAFIFGFSALMIFMYAIFISNFLATYDINVRLIMMAIAIILGVVGAYLMYNGVGRQLEK